MKVIKSPKAIQDISTYYRATGKSIGFVPTMGFLHKGHISLINRARTDCDILIVSIFVNPRQFSPEEDFNKYPRNFLNDYENCKSSGTDYIFHPETDDMYPDDFCTEVCLKGISEKLEGKYRPGHFNGVATVVLKLINIVKPNKIYFGQKDAQQLILMKRMIKNLNLDTEIVAGKTIREANGLAMSSRNTYLSPEEKEEASVLYKALLMGRDLIINKKVKTGEELEKILSDFIETNSPDSSLQYVKVTDNENLEQIENFKDFKGDVLISLACFYGNTRLIDNIVVRI